jgi:hypothetical protein
MDNRTNTESRPFNRFALVAAAAIAVCATGAVILLAPAAATSGSSTMSAALAAAIPASSTTADHASGYLPSQYVNQGKEMEPVRDYSHD